LNFSGELPKSIFAIIVIIPLQLSRKTCQKLWSLSASAPSDFGSTECTGGWEAYRSDMAGGGTASVWNFSSAKYKSHGLLIDAGQYLKRHAKLGLIEIFYSFNFDRN